MKDEHYAYVDELHEIFPTESDFSLVHSVDSHLYAFVHGKRQSAQIICKWLHRRRPRKVSGALSGLCAPLK